MEMTEQPTQPFFYGPFLEAACFCEKVLIEQDGVKSAIRIIDRINRTVVGPNPPPSMEPFDYQLSMLLKFKSGSARGPMELRLGLEKPSGESPAPQTQTVFFEGDDDRGVDIVANFAVQFDMPGLYWFEVALDNIRVTRLPLRVIYLPQTRRIPGQSGGPPPSQESPRS